MGIFGLIERFFFISLVLVFILVVFLVYHFKNRISVAEKKNESMYGLLTAVVKEIKVLRGMFGLGNKSTTTPPPELSNDINKPISKTTPEVYIPLNNNVQSELSEKEVITFNISALENEKVVVSDMEDSEYSGSGSDTEFESDAESDADSDAGSDTAESELELDNNVDELKENEFTLTEIDHSSEPVIENVQLELVNNVDELKENEFTLTEIEYSSEPVIENVQLELQAPADEPLAGSQDTSKNKLTTEQLKKMNIHQLKTIASQLGITEDISKMKKPDLISLIVNSYDK